MSDIISKPTDVISSTSGMVEAVAQAIYDSDQTLRPTPCEAWEKVPEPSRHGYRRQAIAVLSLSKGVPEGCRVVPVEPIIQECDDIIAAIRREQRKPFTGCADSPVEVLKRIKAKVKALSAAPLNKGKKHELR